MFRKGFGEVRMFGGVQPLSFLIATRGIPGIGPILAMAK